MVSKYNGNPNNIPSPVRTFHNDVYPAISPTRPELSLKGKKVIVTGGGSGIGRATVLAFAAAGASVAILGGRREKLLNETKDRVTRDHPESEVHALPCDITDQAAVKKAAEAIGKWDVLVLNGAYLPEPAPLTDVDIDDWWRSFEAYVNLKGNAIVLQVLLPLRQPGAALLANSSLVINFGAAFTANNSAYVVTKLALTRLMETVAAEVNDLHVVSYHPGGVNTAMYDKFFGAAAAESKAKLGTDSVDLPAHFAVWLASPESRFLNGKFVYANWDVAELKALKDRIETTPFLTQNTLGWPFEPPA